MPDVTIAIGGRSFVVACQEGEERYLHAAAKLLDVEAEGLAASGARLTQERMLLMAGLMLADKALSTDEEFKALEKRVAQQAAQIDDLQDRPDVAPREVEVRVEVPVEVPVLPEGALTRMADLADQAEEIAAQLADQASD